MTLEITPQAVYDNLSLIRDARLNTPASLPHSVVIPGATYSPWLENSAFVSTYEVVRSHTLVDKYRCYELWQLVGQVACTEGDIIEVGVWRGGTGCLIARQAALLSPVKQVFLCDTFAGVVKAGDMDATYEGGEHADTSVACLFELVTRLGVDNIEVLSGVFPDQTARKIDGRCFSFCHIDVDVYLSARDILDWVWPRMNVGGVIVFDDYGFSTCNGVTRLVNERIPTKNAITLHNLNGHAVMIKIAP